MRDDFTQFISKSVYILHTIIIWQDLQSFHFKKHLIWGNLIGIQQILRFRVLKRFRNIRGSINTRRFLGLLSPQKIPGGSSDLDDREVDKEEGVADVGDEERGDATVHHRLNNEAGNDPNDGHSNDVQHAEAPSPCFLQHLCLCVSVSGQIASSFLPSSHRRAVSEIETGSCRWILFLVRFWLSLFLCFSVWMAAFFLKPKYSAPKDTQKERKKELNEWKKWMKEGRNEWMKWLKEILVSSIDR